MSLAGIMAALVSAATLQASNAQSVAEPQEPESTLADVVVTGRTRAAVREFVADLTMGDVPDRQIARFDRFVCPGVTGMRPRFAQAVNDQIARVAYALRLNVGEPGCHPNILVVAAANEAQLSATIDDLAPGRDLDNDVSRYGSASVRRLRDPKPVRWWHQTRYVSQNQGSRLNEPGRVELTAAVVLLDMEKVGDVNVDALIDYISVVALASINPDASFAGRDSVLGLFESTESRLSSPGLTSWDADYLQSLYAAPRDGRRSDQEAYVAWRMMRRDASDAEVAGPP